MADLETLTLQINAESQKAYNAIDKLAQRLNNLSVSIAQIETGKLNQLAFGLQNLSTVVEYMNSKTNKSSYKHIVTNISQLAAINTAGIDTLSTSLSTLTSSMANMAASVNVADNIKQLILAIGKLGGKSITTAIANIPQLEAALSHLITTFSKLPNVNQNVIDFTNSLANLASQGSRIGSATNSINQHMNHYGDHAHKATKRTKSLASAIGKMYAEFWIAMRAAKGLKNAFKDAADYLEAYNYFDVTAGKIGADAFREAGVGSAEAYATAFTETLQLKLKQMSGLELDLEDRLIKTTNAKSLGLNLTELTQYQASIASITNAMGASQTMARSTAKVFSMLSADLGSLKNLDFEQVSSNLQSALAGQARAIYKYGIDITQATLEQYAYNAGIEKSVSEMTQNEKAQLRLLAILDQSKVAWGDLANTINSPSNQLRQLKNNLKEVGTVFGQLFIPVISKALPYINGLSIAIKNLLVDIAGLLGINLNFDDFGKGFSEGIEEDVEAVDDLNKAMKETKRGIREFDELKVIGGDNSKAGSGLADQIDLTKEILEATNEYEKVWDEAYARMTSKAQEISGYISAAFEPIKKIIKDFHIGDFFQAGKDVSGLVTSIFNFCSDAINKVDWDGLGQKIGDFIAGIDWVEILKSIGGLIWSAIQGALDAWHGSFSVAPFETAIITAFALLKFTSLGQTLTTNLQGTIVKWFTKKGIDKDFLTKAGLGALSIGLSLSFFIQNVTEVQAGKYSAFSLQSLAKSTISSLLMGAGFMKVASALGMSMGPLGFAVTSGISLAISLIAAKMNEPERNIEQEIARQQYEWVEQSHLDTIDVITKINLKQGEIDTQFLQIDDLAEKVYSLSLEYDNLTDGEKNLLKYYSDELVKVMPELADQIDGVTGAYKGTREELEKLIETQKNQIKMDAIKESLTEATKRQYELKPEFEKVQQNMQKDAEAYREYVNQLKDVGFSYESILKLQQGESFDDVIYNQTKYSENYYEDSAKLWDGIGKIGTKNLKQLYENTRASQEAFQTLEGDWKALEETVEYYTGELETTVDERLKNTNQSVQNNSDTLSGKIKDSKLPTEVKGLMGKVAGKIEDGEKVSKTEMNNMFDGINNSFAGLGDGKVPEEVQATMDNIKYAILTNSPMLIEYMATLRKQMEDAFVNAAYDKEGNAIWNVNNISTRLGRDVGKIEEALQHTAKPILGDLEDDLKELFGGKLPDEIDEKYKKLADTIKNGEGAKAVTAALNDLKLTFTDFAEDAGMNIDLSLGYSIDKNGHFVYTALENVSDKGEQTYKKKNEMASPSKLYKRLGKYIPDGIALGIEDGTNEVDKSMDRLAASMQSEFKDYRWNIPSMNLGRPNVGNGFNYGNMDSQNAFMSQMANAVNQAAANGQTEVIFRIEGDPHGMFTVMMEEDSKYKKQTHGRSAFA